MLTHSQIHQLVSQRKMTPERAADILVGRRSYWDQSQAKGLLAACSSWRSLRRFSAFDPTASEARLAVR